LIQKRLLAFRPWNSSDPDGTYQLLPVPSTAPKSNLDMNAFLNSIIKSVS
jgi:hypothetical protein